MSAKDQRDELAKIKKKFEKKDDMYHKYIGRRFYMAFFCGIVGFFITYYGIATFIRNKIVVTNDYMSAYELLSAEIPETEKFVV